MTNAVNMVAIKTPFARLSLLIRRKRKKAIRFKIAPKAKRLPTWPCWMAARNVSLMLRSENSTMYNNVPMVLTIIPTRKPVAISFLWFFLDGSMCCNSALVC